MVHFSHVIRCKERPTDLHQNKKDLSIEPHWPITQQVNPKQQKATLSNSPVRLLHVLVVHGSRLAVVRQHFLGALGRFQRRCERGRRRSSHRMRSRRKGFDRRGQREEEEERGREALHDGEDCVALQKLLVCLLACLLGVNTRWKIVRLRMNLQVALLSFVVRRARATMSFLHLQASKKVRVR